MPEYYGTELDNCPPEELEWFEKNSDKHFVPVDPKTKQVHEAAKECFWGIVSAYASVPAGGNMNKPTVHLAVQRYYRLRTYQLRSDAKAGLPGGRKHEAWNVRNAAGEITELGSRYMALSDFRKQFVEDGEAAATAGKPV